MSDRLLDAVCNRLREGLRVLEDQCRFVANDAELTAQLKLFRHDCTSLERDLGIRREKRRSDCDVGRTISAPSSSKRKNAGDINAASWARVQEALRSLEEHLKLEHPPLARRAEKLRYRAYDVQTFAGRQRARQWPLYALITDQLSSHPLDKLVSQLIRGGVTAIQLREKNLTDRKLLTRAKHLKKIVGSADVQLILNDRPDLAILAGFDGVHVGQSDLSPKHIKQLYGQQLFVGLSTHSPAQAMAAVKQGADYIGIGPVFATTTKPHLKFIGTKKVKAMVKAAGDLPHVCIGGINTDNAAQVVDAGARGLALCTGLIAVKKPQTVARNIIKTLM